MPMPITTIPNLCHHLLHLGNGHAHLLCRMLYLGIHEHLLVEDVPTILDTRLNNASAVHPSSMALANLLAPLTAMALHAVRVGALAGVLLAGGEDTGKTGFAAPAGFLDEFPLE